MFDPSVILRLDAALRAVCPIAGVAVPTLGDNASVRIDYDAAATGAQRAAALAALAAFDWDDFAGHKAAAVAAVDAATQVLLAAGFAHGGPGQKFPLDLASQTTWLGLLVTSSAGLVTLPQTVQAIDHSLLVLATTADVQGFCLAAAGRVQQLLSGGVALKAALTAAATRDQVDAVVDDRT